MHTKLPPVSCEETGGSFSYSADSRCSISIDKQRRQNAFKRCCFWRHFYILSIKANTTACCSSLSLDQRSRSFLCESVNETGASPSANSWESVIPNAVQFFPRTEGWGSYSCDTTRKSWTAANLIALQAGILSSLGPLDMRLWQREYLSSASPHFACVFRTLYFCLSLPFNDFNRITLTIYTSIIRYMVDLTDFLIAYARQPVQAGLAANHIKNGEKDTV